MKPCRLIQLVKLGNFVRGALPTALQCLANQIGSSSPSLTMFVFETLGKWFMREHFFATKLTLKCLVVTMRHSDG